MPRKSLKSAENFKHDEAKRNNITSAEHQFVIQVVERPHRELRYPRNTDLDPHPQPRRARRPARADAMHKVEHTYRDKLGWPTQLAIDDRQEFHAGL